MNPVAIESRHGDTHYANIQFGYYALIICCLYIILLVLLRKLIPRKYIFNNNSGLLRKIYLLNPWLCLSILFSVLSILFVGRFSFLEHLSVYIKRLGRLSYVVLILAVFLALRPNYLLHDYHYLEFIPLHKWLSRIILILSITHGSSFLIKWAIDKDISIIDKVFKNIYNFLGFLVFLLFVMLLFASLKPVRRYKYGVFYFFHNSISIITSLLIPFHARPSVTFPFFSVLLVMYIYYIFSRIKFSKSIDILEKNSDNEGGSKLCHIIIPRSCVVDNFYPGSHLRISQYRKLNPLYWLFPSHPFTIASLPQDDHIDLIVREHNGFKFKVGQQYTVINSYNTIPSSLLTATRLVIVCGGSGISFGLPIARFFQDNVDLNYFKFAWMVKDRSDLHIFNKFNYDTKNLDVFITKSVPSNDVDNSLMVGQNDFSNLDMELELESMESMHMLNEMSDVVKNKYDNTTYHFKSIKFGRRLDWTADFPSFIESTSLETTWLVCCGPQGIISAGNAYALANNINIVTETYAL